MKKLLIAVFVIVAATSVIYCKKADLKVYTNSSPGFTFQYPGDWKKVKTKGSTEVARYSAKNMYKLPVLVANVYNQNGEFDPEQLPQDTIDRLSKSAPGVSGFTVSEQKTIALKDGSEGHLVKMSWIWVDGKTKMETISVSSEKDGKIVTLSGTAFTDQKLSDVLNYLCMTLSMTP